ncbi:MAG: hypothetical protein HQL52_19455 [Magnetococcales bacterium]|nr:hypothetical protein [Magnetococcales bacterium]
MDHCQGHSNCPYVAEMATIRTELGHIITRLDKGEARFVRMEGVLERLEKAEQQMIGGYRLFRKVIALLAATAAFLAIPWLGKLFGG